MRTLLVVIALLLIVIAVLLMTAAGRWRSRTTADVAKLDQLSDATTSTTFEAAQLHGLRRPIFESARLIESENTIRRMTSGRLCWLGRQDSGV